MAFATLDDGQFGGMTVGLRLDINSPIDDDGTPTDDSRFRAHLETIDELLAADAAIVVIAHQGRPGRDDFAPLAGHADHLGVLLDREVRYVDALWSADARRAIDRLDGGEVLCLENVRFASEELLTLEPLEPAATHLVSRLSEVLDCYVNDAFAVSHRAQPSVVGFPAVLPSYAGRLLEREVDVLGDLGSTPTPRVAMLGGAKVDDSLELLERLLDDGLVERVFVGGLVANVALLAAGVDPGAATRRDVVSWGYEDAIDRARSLLERFGDRIVLPEDVVVAADDDRSVVAVDAFPIDDGVPRDVGPATIEAWQASLTDAATVVCNGPLGQFEDDRFSAGSAELFTAAANVEVAIAGGGDTSAALSRFDIDGFSHVSTGGGAALTLLSGRPLPGVQALNVCTSGTAP